jgi:coenzyme Q-binding protein COQ10
MEPVKKKHHIPNASPRQVYDIVVDYETYPKFFPEFVSVFILDQEESAQIVEFTARYSGKNVEYTLRIEHDEDALQTSWTFVGGDLKNSVGGWHFKDDGKGGTDIDYQISVEVGFFVPRMVSDRLIAKNIPEMFDLLDKEVSRRLSQ